ncbi:hypothetical protein IPL68_02380 [Candidatus Saccharibacteria bacterium]|nr:MAG: hypothetical protein IPL68_02380 [Candidatus Saccharibacteria bacterium]
MSERITLTGSEASDSESNSEKDSSDSKTSGKGRGGRGLGSLAARTTGRGPEAKSDTTKSEVAEKSKPILDRIFGVKDSLRSSRKQRRFPALSRRLSKRHPKLNHLPEKPKRILQALAGEGEINLRDLSKVPESRDEAIVKQAVEEVVSQQAAEVGVVEVSSEVSDELENQAKTEPDEQLEKVP